MLVHCALGWRTVHAWAPSSWPQPFNSSLAPLRSRAFDGRVPGGNRAYPLSPMQRGMLATALAHPGSGADMLQVVVRTRERFDPNDVRDIFQHLVDETEALRVAFSWQDGPEPSQWAAPRVQLPFEHIVGRPLEPFLLEDSARQFAMQKPPLSRVSLLELNDGSQALVWSSHHAIIDGRTVFSLLRRFEALRAARAAGQPWALEPSPSGLAFLNEALASIDQQRAKAHWRGALDGLSTVPRLSLWPSSPEKASADARHLERARRLDAKTSQALESMAQRYGATLNNVVQAAWAITLASFTGERDVLFGATRSGRPSRTLAANEPLGNFINTVPLRAQVRAEDTFSELLVQVKDSWRASRDFAQVSLRDIQTWCGYPTAEALLETSVSFELWQVQQWLERGSSAWRQREVMLKSKSGLPLMLLANAGDELELRLEYDADRFPLPVAESLLDTMCGLLEQVAADALVRVSALELTRGPTPKPARPTTPFASWVTLLELAVQKHAERPAVIAGTTSLTYRELWELSGRFVQGLLQRGVKPGDAVVVLLERGVSLAAAFWALQRLGAVYVPIEPAHAATQLPHALSYHRVRAVLTSRSRGSLGTSTAVPVLYAEQLAVERALHTDAPTPGADTPAYTLFTSGSTGVPKAVEVSAGSLARYARKMGDHYGASEQSRWLQLASLSFDISIEEMCVPWACGGAVVFKPSDVLSGVAELERWLSDYAITAVSPPTALWHEWVNHTCAVPPSLKLVVIGGEAASAAAYRTWAASAYAGVRLLNAYGPTETTVSATVFEPTGANDSRLSGISRMPIGTAVDGTSLLVLDEQRRRVPLGAPGELYIGGDGVALGYAGDAAATKRAFVDVQLGAQSFGRMFRSGDLVYQLPSGDLCFIERKDRQAKVRGFRVDLEGLEALTAQHPKVAQALFRLVGAASSKRLLAYVVPTEPGLTEAEVVAHLRRVAPPFAIPDSVVLLERLPVTAAGKVNVAALPVPEVPAAPTLLNEGDTDDVLTAQVLAAFRALFAGRSVGLDSRFFDELGGDSLMAVRLTHALQRQLSCVLPVGVLAKADSPRALADELRTRLQSAGVVRCALCLRAGNTGSTPLFLVHGGDGHALAFRALVAALPAELGVWAFDAGAMPGAAEHVTVEQLATRYAKELTDVYPSGPVWLAGYCMGGRVVLELCRLLASAGRQVEFVGLINAYAPGYPQLRSRPQRLWRALQAEGSGPLTSIVPRVARRLFGALIRRLNGTTGTEQLSPLELSLCQAQLQHVPSRYDGPVALFRGTAVATWFEPDDLGWSQYLTGLVDLYPRLPVHHTQMLFAPWAEQLAQQLQSALPRSVAVTGPTRSRLG